MAKQEMLREWARLRRELLKQHKGRVREAQIKLARIYTYALSQGDKWIASPTQ